MSADAAGRGRSAWFNRGAPTFLGRGVLGTCGTTADVVHEGDRAGGRLPRRRARARAGDARVLDAGCGPGRHSLELARRGISTSSASTRRPTSSRSRASGGRRDLPVEFREADVRDLDVRRASSTPSSACARAASGSSAATTASSTSSPGFAAALRPGRRARAERVLVVLRRPAPRAGRDVRRRHRRQPRARRRARRRRRRAHLRPLDDVLHAAGAPARSRRVPGSSSTASSACIPGEYARDRAVDRRARAPPARASPG